MTPAEKVHFNDQKLLVLGGAAIQLNIIRDITGI